MPTELPLDQWQPALQGFYKDEKILTQKVDAEDNGVLRVTFKFGSYDRTISSMGHVSSVQMTAAMVESLFILAYKEILSGRIQTTITPDNFRSSRSQAILMRQPPLYKPNPLTGRILQQDEEAYLDVELNSLRRYKHQKIVKMIADIDGFMNGDAECIFPEE